MAFHNSSSSSTPVESQAKRARALRVETQTKHATHNAVKAEGLSLFIGTRCLLENAELKIAEQFHTVDISTTPATAKRIQSGTCYGLVGVNGCGKSTLLQAIAEGRVPVPPGWDSFIVNQHLPLPSERNPVEEVMSANTKRAQLLAEQACLEEEISRLAEGETGRLEEASTRLIKLQAELSQWDGTEEEVIHILRSLGFRRKEDVDNNGSEPTEETPMQKLSGGWRMKVELAKALWLKPKLLLLDEPTNHLDFKSLQWLSDQLEQYPHTTVVVSHDVNFLYGVCREILWLKDLKLEYLPRDVVSQEELLRMQRARALNFSFVTPEGSDTGNHGLSLHGVEFRYSGDSSSIGSKPPHLRVKKEVRFGGSSRAVLLGKNGSGKSTFLDLCAGKLKPTRGSIDATPDLKIGHFSQFTDEFDKNSKDTAASYLVQNCREELAGHAGSTKATRLHAALAAEKQGPPDSGPKAISEKRLVEIARAVLNNFGYEGDVSTTVPIECLSGGQKALLKFAVLSLRPAHILLLDEPSNHLDAEACEALAKGLSEFKGGIVATTHDELLIYRLINCNWSSSELLICREGTVWRQQNFAADCLKALSKEVHGAEEGVVTPTSTNKSQLPPEPQPTSSSKDAAGNAKETVVTKKGEVPPWLQKKPRAKRTGGQEPATDSAVEPPSEASQGNQADVADKAEVVESAKKSVNPQKQDIQDVATGGNKTVKSNPRSSDTGIKAKSKAIAQKTNNSHLDSHGAVDGEESQIEPKWLAPEVRRNTTRTPTQMPNQSSSWEDELWQLQRLYDTCQVEAGSDGERIVRCTHHCTDPDWEAVNWAPTGVVFEVRVGRFYPEPPVQEPILTVLSPEGLPEKFKTILPLLFAESVSKAAARTPAVYRGLQYVDKHMATVWCKIQAAAVQAAQTKALEKEPEGASSNVGGSGSNVSLAAATPKAVPPMLPAATAELSWNVEDAKRLGVEVRLLGLTLEGFSGLLPSALRMEVVCGRCRKPSEIATADGVAGNVPHTADASCPTCQGVLSVQVVPSACLGGCQAIAHILGIDCHPVQLLKSDYEARCSECSEVARIRNVGPGYHKQSKCTGCFTKLNIAVEDADILGKDVEKWRLVADEEGEQTTARKQLQEARRMEKGLGVKVGQPLPDNGACKHYKQAFRWLRFPCCRRAFPCDVCHDEQTDHSAEWASRMLCGLCSHEQAFTKEQCAHCGASQNKSRGGYWEGGEGCRDRSKMAKDDPHKYKGLGKTVPKKK